ncbi:MAG: DUF1003 domain-containing protein [Methanothrix sp.]|jgi:uncharacterized membrane protein|nr:DUF1003 domain-containing protein [Methanothrix sp.]
MKKLAFPDPFRHDHPPVRELSEIDPGPSTYGERFADWVYKNLGSWKFILIQSMLVAVWVVLNAGAYLRPWDPYPFIFMNLIFSLQSAYTASLILMSQNRQDRLKSHNDYLMNLRAEEESKAVLENFAAQNKALQEIYEELSAMRSRIEIGGCAKNMRKA